MNAPQSPQAALPKPQFVNWMLRLVAGLLVLLVLIRFSGGKQVLATLGTVSWRVLLAAVLFYWAGQMLSAFKWQLLLRAQGAALPFRECCRLYLVGMFCNLWLPTNIGGDAMRVLLATPRCPSATVAVTSILVERLTGFLALLLIGFTALLMDASSRRAETIASPMQLMTHAAVGLGLFCCFFFISRAFAYRLSIHKPQHQAARRWVALHRALDEYIAPKRRTVLLSAMLLSLLFQISQVVLNIALAHAVGLNVGALVMWWLVPMLALASLLPVGIGGLGVREAAAVKLLAVAGPAGAAFMSTAVGSVPVGMVSAQTVIAWSLLWQATVWLASLPGAWWWNSSGALRTDTEEPDSHTAQ